MWFFFALAHAGLLASVNYLDQYLTDQNSVSQNTSIHRQVGGLLIISTLMTSIGAAVLFFTLESLVIGKKEFWLALGSALPMVTMWIVYFTLLLKYPAHQVVALFQLSTLFLLLLEVLFGATIGSGALAGVALLVIGAYLLDAGTLQWKIPTTLLLTMIPCSFVWALSLFMVRVASENALGTVISFYQLIGVFGIGLLLLLLVRPYRLGFLHRIKNQGKKFLGFSFLNEGLSQLGYIFAALSIAAAPLATYFSALSGFQSLFVLVLFFLFPIDKKESITRIQVTSIVFIAVGAAMIELWK